MIWENNLRVFLWYPRVYGSLWSVYRSLLIDGCTNSWYFTTFSNHKPVWAVYIYWLRFSSIIYHNPRFCHARGTNHTATIVTPQLILLIMYRLLILFEQVTKNTSDAQFRVPLSWFDPNGTVLITIWYYSYVERLVFKYSVVFCGHSSWGRVSVIISANEMS